MKQFKALSLAILSSSLFSHYISAECVSGNCSDGQGTYTLEDGRTYTGQWKNDKRDGQGTFTWLNGDKYVGFWKNDEMHGQGTFSGLAGWKYVGQWHDSQRHGQGTNTAADGTQYTGEWVHGVQEGQGTYLSTKNEKYVGQWENAKMHGHGTYTWPDGKKYVGEWQNDLAHGQGTYSWVDGTVYTGQLKEGKRHGLGTLTYSNGAKYIGFWKHDERDGRGTAYTKKGLIKNQIFEKDKKIESALVFKSKAWYPKEEGKSAFGGRYRTTTHETMSELYLLEDNTFCFAFMGGSQDIMVAGTWVQSQQQPNTILLKETQIDKEIHLANAQQFNRLDNKISVTVNGYGLDIIDTPVFAISNNNKPPKAFTPLLPEFNSRGRATYAFPLFSPSEAKYFYLGSLEKNETDNKQQLHVTQYAIGDNDTFQLVYDTNNSQLPKTFNAQLTVNGLVIDGQPTDSKTALFPEMVKAVKEQCITPATQPQNNANDATWVRLIPSNHYILDKNIITKQSHFTPDDGDEARRSNGINELIEDEKKLLALHYQKTQENPKAFQELLTLSTALLQQDNRKDVHVKDVSLKLTQLFVDTLVRGDVQSARVQFDAFVEQVHPLIKDSRDRQAQHTILVIASQAAVIYGATRDIEVFNDITNTLLGERFDIEKTKNPTLAYNLACIYALTKHKPEMLQAIRAARKMNKETALFLTDGDFEYYRSDSDFLEAIK